MERGFVKINQHALAKLSGDREVSLIAKDCLYFIISKIGYDNLARLSNRDIVKALGVSPRSITDALASLKAKGYIAIDTSKRPQVFEIPNWIAQKGAKKTKGE